MPNNTTMRRQRALGGALGILVLGFALTYHFFPRLFHLEPNQKPRRSMSLPMDGDAASVTAQPEHVPELAELNAGPPLALAPITVIVAHEHKNANLPEQKSADTPAVQELLNHAAKAMREGKLAGAAGSAASLFEAALKEQPDSRAAAQGLFDVRARLVVGIDQDIAVGDAEAATDLLNALRTLPNADEEVKRLEGSLATLATVRPMLAKAADLLAQGKADLPPGRSALDVYREVQKLDPQNAVAEQGIFEVQRAVLDRALAAVAQNDFAGADSQLAIADTIRPGSQQMQDVRKRINGMREQRASGILTQARSALDSGNTALAKNLAAQARAIDPGIKGLEEFDEMLTNARLYASYKPGQVFSERYVDMPGNTPAMVVIPTGQFEMGTASDDSESEVAKPSHEVTIKQGFALARGEVTVGQFREFVRTSGYVPDSVKLGGASVYDERSGTLRDDSGASWEDDYAGSKAGDNLPVVNVSWNDARAYAEWLSKRTGKNYRLPSEAEFEYALRGGTTTRYWWGDGRPGSAVENLTGSGDHSRSGRRWSNSFRNYHDGFWGPAPTMSFKPNPFGLYDINGNVSEWVADCWHDNYIRAPSDGGAWLNPGCATHVVRGGSWGSSPEQVASAYRQGASGELRSGRVGFRVAREL